MLSKIVFVLAVTIIGQAIAVCKLTGKWGPACTSPKMIVMDDVMKNAIVNIHNQLRNEIALGNIENYDQAANMATMQWDDSLAAKAALNVLQCEMEHDDCRKTAQFPYAGQNLAMSMDTGAAESSPNQIAQSAAGWFDEQKNGGLYGWMDNINEFTTLGEGDYEVGHFTQFVWASANRIGCAVSTSKIYQNRRYWNATWLACNYNYGNMEDEAVYKSGEAASGCSTGNNNQYPGLCSPIETYDN